MRKIGVCKMAGIDVDDNVDNPVKNFSVLKTGVVWRYRILQTARELGGGAQTQHRVQSGWVQRT